MYEIEGAERNVFWTEDRDIRLRFGNARHENPLEVEGEAFCHIQKMAKHPRFADVAFATKFDL